MTWRLSKSKRSTRLPLPAALRQKAGLEVETLRGIKSKEKSPHPEERA